MVTNPELDDLDLGSVIDAVKRASDNELAKLTEISNKLDGGVKISVGAPRVQAELDANKAEKAVKDGVENATLVVKPKRKLSRRNRPVAQRATRSNEVELEINSPEIAKPAQPVPTPVNRIADNPEPESQQQTLEKRERTKATASTSKSDISVSVEPPKTVLEKENSLDDIPDKVEQAVKDGLSGFEGYWKDAAGKLRRKDGKYASKQETQAYSAAEVARQRQQEKAENGDKQRVGVFAQFASTLKELTKERVKSTLEKDNDATDAAGAAAGGAFFYSAKEIFNLSKETKEAFSEVRGSVAETQSKLSSTRDAIANSKISRLFGFKVSSENALEIERDKTKNSVNGATISSELSETETLKSASEVKAEPKEQANRESLINRVSGQPVTEIKVKNDIQGDRDGAGVASIEKTRDEKATSSAVNHTNSNSIATHSQVATQINNPSQIDKAKDSQYKSEHLEVLKEQSIERKSMVNEIIDKLDEVKSAAAKASDGGGNGLLDLAGDLFDRKGRRRGRAGRGGKAGKIRSIFSRGAGGVASKSMSMASGAFKGLSKLGSVAGKAVPFIAPALMAYDAISGFTDSEKQKETFHLKDGQQATAGQKSSMALANLLDMGGLVSGGIGLLGNALGALGFERMQEALTFDSGDMARGIYGMFGSSAPEQGKSIKPVVKAESEKEHEYSANAIEYRQADRFEREMMERKADPHRLTTERVKERATETGKSFGYTYKRMSREREALNQERQQLAEEMGLDISGKVEHPDLGVMYSPQKKRDQLKIVDQEISRRREVESIAKQGEFRNGRFIGSEPKGYVAPLNTKNSIQQQKANAQSAPTSQESSFATDVMPVMANAESRVKGNERVSEIKAKQQDKAFRQGEKPKSVKLDDETIKKLSSANVGHSTTTIFKESKTKEAVSTAKPTGSIPNNFSDRSLQRQSADLE